jgi:hypothetical protein
MEFQSESKSLQLLRIGLGNSGIDRIDEQGDDARRRDQLVQEFQRTAIPQNNNDIRVTVWPVIASGTASSEDDSDHPISIEAAYLCSDPGSSFIAHREQPLDSHLRFSANVAGKTWLGKRQW